MFKLYYSRFLDQLVAYVAGSSYSVECDDYDPRRRPWYVAASSGPKDVVIIMDISASMDDEGRLPLAQDAVASVLSTMNEHTYTNMVLFSTDVSMKTKHHKSSRDAINRLL